MEKGSTCIGSVKKSRSLNEIFLFFVAVFVASFVCFFVVQKDLWGGDV